MKNKLLHIYIIIFLSLSGIIYSDEKTANIVIGEEYYVNLLNSWIEIFPDGNRNAAGPKFFSFALEQSLNIEDFLEYNKLYCAVSGSVLQPGGTPDLLSIYEDQTNNLICGEYYKCCWPCSCDLMKYAKTKKANFIFENLEYDLNVLIIKDPCQKENFPKQVNKDYFCKNNKLCLLYTSPSPRD